MRRVSDEERRRCLAWRHRLVPAARASSPIDVARDLVALHSSDPVTVFLAVAARLDDPSVDAVEAALYDARTLVRHHAMRRTIWVMTPEVTRWAHAACTRKIAAAERKRLVVALDGDDAWLDATIDDIVALLAGDGPLTAREVLRRLPHVERTITVGSGSYRTEVSGHSRALLQAGFDGRVVRAAPRGSWTSSQYAWAERHAWLDIDLETLDVADGARELVGAWLDRFGPGTVDDIVWWTGMTKTAVRAALADLDVEAVALAAGEGVMAAGDAGPDEHPGPWVALLPGLDPTAMGWKRRDWYLDPATAARVTDRAGNIGPTVWADGLVVGGWLQRPDGEIALDLSDELRGDHHDLLAAEVERLRAFVGDTRFRVRFLSPSQRRLLG